MEYDGQLHRTPEDVLESIRTRIRDATEEVVLSLPVVFFSAVRDDLQAAVERDIFVMLLTHSYREGPDVEPVAFSEAATVARRTEDRGQVFCITDKEWGMDGHRLSFAQGEDTEIDDQYRFGTTIRNPVFAQALYGYLVADDWSVADEVYIKPRAALPVTFQNFRRAVVEATLFLREGDLLDVSAVLSEVDSDETIDVEGTVVNARQTVVHPISSSFPSEHSLFLEVDGERVSLGGRGSFVEDFECLEITFERVYGHED